MGINIYIFIMGTISKSEKKRIKDMLDRSSSWMYGASLKFRDLILVAEDSIWEEYEELKNSISPNDVVIFYGEEVGGWFCGEVTKNERCDLWSGTHIFCQYGEELPSRLLYRGNFFVVGQTNIATANAFSACLYGGESFDRETGTTQSLREKIFEGCLTIERALIVYSEDVYGKNNRDLIKAILVDGGFCTEIDEEALDNSEWAKRVGNYWKNDSKVGMNHYDLIYLIGRGEDFLEAVSHIVRAARANTVLIANQSLQKLGGGWSEDGARIQTIGQGKHLYYFSPRIRAQYLVDDCKNIDEIWLMCIIQMLMRITSEENEVESLTLAGALLQKHHFHSPFGNLVFLSNQVSSVDLYLYRNRNRERYLFRVEDRCWNLSSGKNLKGEVSEILDKINDYFTMNGKTYVASVENILKSPNETITQFVRQLFKGVDDVVLQVAWEGDDTSKAENLGKVQKLRRLQESIGGGTEKIVEFYRLLKRWGMVGQARVNCSNILQVNCGVEDVECNNTRRLYFRKQEGDMWLPFGLYREDPAVGRYMMTVDTSWSQGVECGDSAGISPVKRSGEFPISNTRLAIYLQGRNRRFVYVIPEENGILGFESYLVLTTTRAFSSVELSLMSLICSRISSRVDSWLENSGDQFFVAWLKIGAVMSRNLAHNLGSHVLSTLAHMKMSNVNRDGCERCLIEDRKLFRYLQHRMAYLTFATTTFPTWSVPMGFVGTVMRTFFSQAHLLNNIAVSEGLGAWNFRGEAQDERSGKIRLHVRRMRGGGDASDIWKGASMVCQFIRYADSVSSMRKGCNVLEVVDLNEDVQVRMPGDVIGQQAFFCILENIIRNAAKHGWAHPPESTLSTKTRGGNLDVFIEFIEDVNHVHFRIYDNISDVYDGNADNPLHLKQHDRLLKTIRNGLKDNSCLGLSEMRISAGLLLGRSVMDISEKVLCDDLDLDAVAVEDTDGICHLGYKFDMLRGDEILIVVDDEYARVLGNDSSWRRHRIVIKRTWEAQRSDFRFDVDYVVFAIHEHSYFLNSIREDDYPLRSFVVDDGKELKLRMPRIGKDEFLAAVLDEDEPGMKLKCLLYRRWIEYLKRLQWGRGADRIPLCLFIMPFADDEDESAQYTDSMTLPKVFVTDAEKSAGSESAPIELPIGIVYWKSNEFDSEQMLDTQYAILYHRHCNVRSVCNEFGGIYLESLSAAQDEFNVLKGLRLNDFATMTKLVETGLLRVAIVDERVANYLRKNDDSRTAFRMMKIAVLDDKRLLQDMDIMIPVGIEFAEQTFNGQVENEKINIQIEHVWEQDGLAIIDAEILQKIIENISQLNEEMLMACEQGEIDVVVEHVVGNVDLWLKSTDCAVKKMGSKKICSFQELIDKYRRQFDILIIHQGIIDKWFHLSVRTAQHEAVLLEILRLLVPYVILTTGRGRPANIPDSARVLPFEVISNALFKRYPEKSKIIGAIMNLLPSLGD